jgi:hypothetical protein
MIGKILDASVSVQLGQVIDIVVIPDEGLCCFVKVGRAFHFGAGGEGADLFVGH